MRSPSPESPGRVASSARSTTFPWSTTSSVKCTRSAASCLARTYEYRSSLYWFQMALLASRYRRATARLSSLGTTGEVGSQLGYVACCGALAHASSEQTSTVHTAPRIYGTDVTVRSRPLQDGQAERISAVEARETV